MATSITLACPFVFIVKEPNTTLAAPPMPGASILPSGDCTRPSGIRRGTPNSRSAVARPERPCRRWPRAPRCQSVGWSLSISVSFIHGGQPRPSVSRASFSAPGVLGVLAVSNKMPGCGVSPVVVSGLAIGGLAGHARMMGRPKATRNQPSNGCVSASKRHSRGQGRSQPPNVTNAILLETYRSHCSHSLRGFQR